MENNGWIRLHRSIMDTPDWFSEPFTKAQAWVDLLLLANRKPGFIRRRGIMVTVERGQVGYSVEALASRWRWSKCKALRFFSALTIDERITRQGSGNSGLSRQSKLDQTRIKKTIPKKTSVSSLITIINYERYQSNDTENDTEERPKTIPEQEGKEVKEPPCDFSSEISSLKDRYPDQETINRAFRAISSTRKTNRIADTVTLSILKGWERYPVEAVTTGIKAYLDKGYADQGKKEDYLLGIIRNNRNGQHQESASTKKMPGVPPPLICLRCGRDLVVKNDLYGEGCIHCEPREMRA